MTQRQPGPSFTRIPEPDIPELLRQALDGLLPMGSLSLLLDRMERRA